VLASGVATAQSLPEIVRLSRENREALKKTDQGFIQSYDVVVKEAEGSQQFVGNFRNSRWGIQFPILMSEVMLVPHVNPEDSQRSKCTYDYESNTSVNLTATRSNGVRRGSSIKFMPYKSVHFEGFCYPVRLLFLPESERLLFGLFR